MILEIDVALLVIIGLGSLASAVLAIWTLLTRVKSSFKDIVTEIVGRVVKENIADSEGRTQKSIEASERRQIEALSGLKIEIEANRQDDLRDKKEAIAAQQLTQHALVEAYKQDFRDIYYILRETGEISDHDKAYIDKIYPYYKQLGGNSDIAAKYEEICRVVDRRTQEAFDKARAKKRKKALPELQTLEAEEVGDDE
jgi:hypothetical protein